MDPILHNWQEVLTFLGILFGTGTGAYIFYRRVVHKAVCKICDAIRHFFTIGGKVEYMYSELKPNGGTSIKDSINRIEDNLIFMMSKHKIIIDDYHTGLLETDAEGKVTWANATYLNFTGRQLKEVLGNGWINVVCPEDRDRVFQDWLKAVEQNRSYEGEFCIMPSSGQRIKVKGFAAPIQGKERIRGYIGKVQIIMEEEENG